MKRIIRPKRDLCECGSLVTNHHWYCNVCWKKKNKDRIKMLAIEDRNKVNNNKRKTGRTVIINPLDKE